MLLACVRKILYDFYCRFEQVACRDAIFVIATLALFELRRAMGGIITMLLLFLVLIVLIVLHWNAEEPARQRYDVAVALLGGVVLPLLCFAYDPGAFTRSALIQSILYPLVIFQIVVLLAWLTASSRMGPALSGFCAGAMLFGGLYALFIGLLMLPITFMLLSRLIGILFSIPFVTSYVYLTQFWRAFVVSRRRKRGWFAGLCGVLIAMAIVPSIGYWVRAIYFPNAEPLPMFGNKLIGESSN